MAKRESTRHPKVWDSSAFKTIPGDGHYWCIIAPRAQNGIYYNDIRKWWKTRWEAEQQAKNIIIEQNNRAVLIVVKATMRVDAMPNFRVTNVI